MAPAADTPDNPECETRTSMAPPTPNREHIDNCSFSSWYPRFSHCSFRSRIIRPLPEAFVAYLDAESVFLPANALRSNPKEDYDVYSSDGEDDSDNDDNNNDENQPSFPDLEAQIRAHIDDLGGAVFPKLNWSSPKDAAWIAFSSSLKCNTPADIFLLLKSSDFIAHDLEQAYKECRQPFDNDASGLPQRPVHMELVLREWFDLTPSMEFRCFVRNNQLKCVSQRDTANHYAFLVVHKTELVEDIVDFYVDHIAGKFPDPDYVFDVYINARTHKVWLIDFNPFAPSTDTLLFKWSEILNDRQGALPATATNNNDAIRDIITICDFRIIKSAAETQNSNQPAYALNRLPLEAFAFSQDVTVDEMAERFSREIHIAQASTDTT